MVLTVVLAGAALAAAYLAAPASLAPTVYHGTRMATAVGLAYVVVRRRLPGWFWGPITGGVLLTAGAQFVDQWVDPGLVPEVVRLAAYPLWLVSVVRVARRHLVILGQAWLIDSLLSAIAAAIVVFTAFSTANWALAAEDGIGTAMQIAVPALDALLLAAGIAVAASVRAPQVRFALAALACTLASDLATLHTSHAHPHPVVIGWLITGALWLAAALDDPAGMAASASVAGRSRNTLLVGGSIAAAPLAYLWLEAFSGSPTERVVVAVLALVSAFLVTVRHRFLQRRHDEAMQRERGVSAAVASVMSADGAAEALEAAFHALCEIAAPAHPIALAVVEPVDGRYRPLMESLHADPALKPDWSELGARLGDGAAPVDALFHGSSSRPSRILALPVMTGLPDHPWLVVDTLLPVDPAGRAALTSLATSVALAISKLERADLAGRARVVDQVASMVEHLPDVMVVADSQLTVKLVNGAAEEMLGARRDRLVGCDLGELFSVEAGVLRDVVGRLGSEDSDPITIRLNLAGTGEVTVVDAVFARLPFAVDPDGIVCTLRDVTRRQAFEQQLRHQALHDSLTGLPNRTLFRERMEQAIVTARAGRSTLAVAFIDIDDFKVINDTLGHSGGDDVIEIVARRLVETTGEALVARLGGDEFAVLMEGVGEQVALRTARRFLDRFEQPVVVEGRSVPITISIGVASSASATRLDSEELLRNADTAMYEAKRRGKNAAVLYEPVMHVAAIELLQLRADLRAGVQRDEFVAHFQPIYELATNGLWGFEALARWNHPTRGLLSPADFIAEAEASDSIVDIGDAVLRQACADLQSWCADPATGLMPKVTVNLSDREFFDSGLLERVAFALESSGLDPNRLVIEITERLVLDDIDGAILRLDALRAMGVGLALDDFGTGYSSLNYLARLPVDLVKLDRTFIAALGGDDQRAASVSEAVVDLARSLGMSVVAEGIESVAQAERLRGLACRYGQGFLLGRPMPGVEASLLASGGAGAAGPALAS